jgi:hypothetical protein
MDAFIQVVAPGLLGVGATALSWAAGKAVQRTKMKRIMPVLARAYSILDPLLNTYIRSYSGSDVEFAFKSVIYAMADGELTPGEIKTALGEAQRRWLPSRAAGKAIDPENVTGRMVAEVNKTIQLDPHNRDISALASTLTLIGKYH